MENLIGSSRQMPPPPPPTFSVPKRNTGKSFERPAKILRGLQRFGKNLIAARALTLQF